jgi:hypothetical protein
VYDSASHDYHEETEEDLVSYCLFPDRGDNCHVVWCDLDVPNHDKDRFPFLLAAALYPAMKLA